MVSQYHNVGSKGSRKGMFFTAQAVCKHDDCGQFRFKIKKKPSSKRSQEVQIDVEVLKTIISHEPGVKKKDNFMAEKDKRHS